MDPKLHYRMNNKPNVAIIDYGAGNQESVKKAFEYVGANAHVIKSPESMKMFSHHSQSPQHFLPLDSFLTLFNSTLTF